MADSRTIMHVDLDAFFVAVEQARDPALRGKPVIVGGDPDGRGVVATASYEARVFGIFSGMALRTARQRCPQAIFVRGDFRAYEEASQRFHRILRDYSPLVERAGLDEAYLDLTGCEAMIEARGGFARGSPHAAGEGIRRQVREELGITVSVGVGSGKSLAKVASDAAKPDGLLAVAPGDEATFLAPRPVRDLPGLGAKAEAELARTGVRTLGQLAAMSEALLLRRFGTWGPTLAERARGIDPTPVASGREAAKSVSREGTYAHDIDDLAVLRASLRGYAESVGADLRRIGRRACCVTLKLRYGDFRTITRSRTLDRPTHSDDELYGTATSLLERALAQDGRAVRLIGLGASSLSDDTVQLGLFEQRRDDRRPPRQLRDDALWGSIDRLRAKYGHRCLQTGLTFFDPYVSSPDWEPHRHTGLSSQVGLEPQR